MDALIEFVQGHSSPGSKMLRSPKLSFGALFDFETILLKAVTKCNTLIGLCSKYEMTNVSEVAKVSKVAEVSEMATWLSTT